MDRARRPGRRGPRRRDLGGAVRSPGRSRLSRDHRLEDLFRRRRPQGAARCPANLDGGLGIWGGAVALGAVGAWIGARRRGIRLPAFGDAIAPPPILLAQAIGRLGNYFNQELYGRETTLPWGLKIYERANEAGYADPPGLIDGKSNGVVVAIVQPTFLYELLWNVLIVVLLVVVDRRFRIGHGRLFALYIAGYCLGRFFIEMLRDDRAAVANDIAASARTSSPPRSCSRAPSSTS